MNPWQNIDLSAIDSPALIVDRQKVKSNIDLALAYASGPKRLRPHVKTHKMKEVARLQMEAGITSFKCATIAEAEMLASSGARDVLIAYQLNGPKIDRLTQLLTVYPKTQFSVLLDNLSSAEELDKKLKRENQSISYYLDINNGNHRTGITIARVEEFLLSVEHLSSLELTGIHCYDGHIRMSDYNARKSAITTAFEPVMTLLQNLKRKYGDKLEIVAGGSPSFSTHMSNPSVICSPGTFVFWDQRYAENYPEQRFQKAAVVMTRVISKVDPHTYCLDLGHKSIASEFPFPRVHFISPHPSTQVSQSEEHLVIECEEADVYEVGQVLLGFPYHICPTVALYNHVWIIDDGSIADKWIVSARNRKITI